MGITKSTTITNLDASPSVIPNVRDSHGRVMCSIETLETATADTAGQIYRFFRVNAQDRILSIKLFNDAITTGDDLDIGIYNITSTSSGAVIDANCYADDIAGDSAIDGVEERFEALDINTVKQAVWEDAGVAADPGNIQYDLAVTINGDVNSASTITLHVLYLAGS